MIENTIRIGLKKRRVYEKKSTYKMPLFFLVIEKSA